MFLKKIHVENYRLLLDTERSFDHSLTLFVGKNNTGKTSISQLMHNVISDSKPQLSIDDYPLVCQQKLYDIIKEFCLFPVSTCNWGFQTFS